MGKSWALISHLHTVAGYSTVPLQFASRRFVCIVCSFGVLRASIVSDLTATVA
jgi:hypothetical protein